MMARTGLAMQCYMRLGFYVESVYGIRFMMELRYRDMLCVVRCAK